MKKIACCLLISICTGCLSMPAGKTVKDTHPKPEAPKVEVAKPVTPDQVTPANAHQQVDALTQEMDRAATK